MKLAGYSEIEEIDRAGHFITYKAWDNAVGKLVSLKVLPEEKASVDQILQLRHEYEILRRLKHPRIPLVFDLQNTEQHYVLVREYKDGILLRDWIRRGEAGLGIKLKIALEILRILDHLHRNGIIHKNLNPYNLLISPNTLEVTLVNFGQSSILSSESQDFVPIALLQENLTYCAPEQTGRVKRRIDYRTDFYGLGNTLYELFSGQPPFHSRDPLELVHAQLAKVPTPPHVIRPDLPEVISGILTKLIAKNPDDRYQSIAGLQHDLEHCLSAWESDGAVPWFSIGGQEVYEQFQIPQRLYGREREALQLLDAFEEVVHQPPKFVFVSGYSGIGKTALIAEIFKPVTESNGIFISGKADQFQRDSPYSALISAFNEFANYVLKERFEDFEYWKVNIRQALGTNAALLADAVPKLELIIGRQESEGHAAPNEIELRFNQAIFDFLGCIASPKHPLVIFLDDLQWVDLATIQLLENLVSWKSPENLMLIGAYRDNEVDEQHPLSFLFERMERTGMQPTEIRLKPLGEADLALLVADTLHQPADQVVRLAELIHQKTLGNPFFAIQLLTGLYDEQYLTFDRESRQWQWDLPLIQSLNVSDNVVDLMSRKLTGLSEEALAMLQYAACLGNSFPLELLAAATESEVLSAFRQLKPAIDQNFLSPSPKIYRIMGLVSSAPALELPQLVRRQIEGEKLRFLHDRVQQAAYLSIPEEERAQRHIQIARLLDHNTASLHRDDRLFDIVGQYNAGLHLLTDPEERLRVAKLNLGAGERAKQSNALREASAYLATGVELLPEDAWKSQYELTWKLYSELAETKSLDGQHEEAEHFFELVHQHTQTPLERLRLSRIRCNLYTKTYHYQKALDVAHDTLAEFGIRFPHNRLMQKWGALRQILTSWWLLRSRVNNWSDIADLPESKDPIHVAITDLLIETGVASYTLNQEVMVMSMLETLKRSIRKGMTGSSTWALMSFATIIGSTFNKYRTAYEISQATEKLFDRVCSRVQKWKTSIVPPAFIDHWIEPRRDTLNPLWNVYRGCVENGEQPMAATSLTMHTVNSLSAGMSLQEVLQGIEKKGKLMKQIRADHGLMHIAMWHQYVKSMSGLTYRFGEVDDEQFNETEYVVQMGELPTPQAHYYTVKLLLQFMASNYGGALETGKKMETLETFLLGQAHVSEYVLFYSLAITQAVAGGETDRRRWTRRLNKNRGRLKTWARFSPVNFQHQYDLVRAEMESLRGNGQKAERLYESAIQGAHRHKFHHHAALASELAGLAVLRQGKPKVAEAYLRDAYEAYGCWGASAKQKQLTQEFPQIYANISPEKQNFGTTRRLAGSASVEDQLDLSSLLKASQSLAGEIKLDQLMDKLMHVLLENAGAEKACLILQTDGNLSLMAEANTLADQTFMYNEDVGQYTNKLPLSVLYYCLHAKEPVVLDRASGSGMFTEDPYIKNKQVASVLCFPIVHQEKMPGLIYLENNLVSGAFSEARIEILRLLSSQIAISLENALLYEKLEEKVRDRTSQIEQQKQALVEEKHQVDQLLLNILPSETAEELKRKGKVAPKYYPAITVMFTDFSRFTQIVKDMPPELLVDELDSYFSTFDEIMDRNGIEKIKTIGDSYMCACGLPNPDPRHAEKMVRAATEIQEFMLADERDRRERGLPIFRVRIGIHSGPVVAGVVGSRKFAYDIWGDTVNVAARLETACEDRKINISSDTFALIEGQFDCRQRGKIAVKHDREIEMYYVNW